jgi:hypothetical protein
MLSGFDDLLTSLAERDTIIVLPQLERALDLWVRITSAIKERHVCQPTATRTAVAFNQNCYAPRVLRLWVPHWIIGEERTLPMDWPEFRRNFQLVSSYYTTRELKEFYA